LNRLLEKSQKLSANTWQYLACDPLATQTHHGFYTASVNHKLIDTFSASNPSSKYPNNLFYSKNTLLLEILRIPTYPHRGTIQFMQKMTDIPPGYIVIVEGNFSDREGPAGIIIDRACLVACDQLSSQRVVTAYSHSPVLN